VRPINLKYLTKQKSISKKWKDRIEIKNQKIFSKMNKMIKIDFQSFSINSIFSTEGGSYPT
jgi:hypothetical protein